MDKKITKMTGCRRLHVGFLVWFVVILMASVAVTGCQNAKRQTTEKRGLSRPIATVNNDVITYEAFQNEFHLFLNQWDRFLKNEKKKKQDLKSVLLDKMIERILLDQEARRTGIEISDAEINHKLKTFFMPLGEQDMEQAAKASAGGSLSQWRTQVRRRLIHEKLIQIAVRDKIRISQREMRSYYIRNKKKFFQKEQVKVRHIAVSNRSAFNKVSRQLRRNRDFVKVVQKYSITPDRQADGDLGYVERGVLPPEFDMAIFNMKKIGSISSLTKPVRTQMGYHVFRLEGRKPRGPLSFPKARKVIKADVLDLKQPKAYGIWMKKLKNRATIIIEKELLKAGLG